MIRFPGAYNVTAEDKETRKLAYDIAYVTAKALGVRDDYVFLDEIYDIPTPEEQKKNTPGTGFISRYAENGVLKKENALGLPSKTEGGGRQDLVDFALEWGRVFYRNISQATGLNYSGEVYNTILNLIRGNTEYYRGLYTEYKNGGADILGWILDVYDRNRVKSAYAFEYALNSGNENGIQKLKAAYIRKYLMTLEDTKLNFVNGAKTEENIFEGKVMQLKAGDLVGIGNEVYLVLYTTGELREIGGYAGSGIPRYTNERNVVEKGKLILVTVSSQESEKTDVIHAFSYSMEMLVKKKEVVWLYSE